MAQYSGPERIKNNAPQFRNVIDLSASTRTLTGDESGSLCVFNLATGVDVTLPGIISAEDVGMWFEFVSGLVASTESYTVTALAGDLLIGRVLVQDTDTANTITSYAPDASDDLIITFSDTADLVGGSVIVQAVSLTRWMVRGTLFCTGNAATPFS